MKKKNLTFSNYKEGDEEYGFDFIFIENCTEEDGPKKQCFYSYHDNGKTIDCEAEYFGSLDDSEDLEAFAVELIEDFAAEKIEDEELRAGFLAEILKD